MSKLIYPDLNAHDYKFDKYPNGIDVDDKIGRMLSYLIAYDIGNGIFRFVPSDNQGRLAVNTGALAKKTGNYGFTTVGVAATLIKAQNDDRNSIIIFNNSSVTIFIGFDNSVTTVIGFPLIAGSSLSFDNYNGDFYGVVAAATQNVHFMEVA